MEIIKDLNGNQLTLTLVGELNTDTAPYLEEVIKNDLKKAQVLVIDMKDLSYLTSAGLRVLLVAQRIMGTKGEMIIRNANSDILDIFDMTGFNNLLTIEN